LEAAERFLDLGGCPLRQRSGSRGVIGRRARGWAFELSRRARARAAKSLRRSSRCLTGASARRPARCLASHASAILSPMTADNDPTPEPAIFSAGLTPHRSLRRNGLWAVMLVTGGISLVAGTSSPPAVPWP